MEDPRTVARQFIVRECRPGTSPDSVPDHARLMEDGTLDSMALVKLASLFEQVFGIEIEAHEVNDENFGSLAEMAAFIERRTSA